MERTSDRPILTSRRLHPETLRQRAAALRSTPPRPRRGVEPLEPGAVRRVLGLWAIGRLTSLTLLACCYSLSRAFEWGFGPHGYPVGTFLDFLTGWDADRYGMIAQYGYPVLIPLDLFGEPVQNNWAFLPLFPYTTRALTDVSGLPWQLSAVLLIIAASAGATVVLFLLLRAVTAPRQAWWATVLFTFAPLSFVFVLGYAESLFLLLVFSALLLAVRRRYAWIAPLGVLAAFSRPGALALALGLGVLFLVRLWRRRVDPFPRPQAIRLALSGATTAVAGLAWPVIADWVSGVPHTYVRTELAWWVPYVGRGDFAPLTPWFRFATTYTGAFGVLLVLAIMALFTAWIASASVRRLGIEVVAFGASYGLYLFAVFLPQQSIARLLLPLSPLLADERLSSTARRRCALLGACLVLQTAAVLWLWTLGYP